MSKKNIIEIVIIVAAFAGCGLVIYNGMFKNTTVPMGAPAANTSNTIQIDKILPNGDKLDFDAVFGKQQLRYGMVNYPKLDPKSDVGVDMNGMVRSPRAAAEAAGQPGTPVMPPAMPTGR